jgi:pimeloyl-ACP methyl ester carboxylesterase
MDDTVAQPGALPLLTRVPDRAGPSTPVLVSVHGISRNADEHLAAFSGALGREWAVIAPVFSDAEFPHFQRIGFRAGEPRADGALDAALEALAARTGLDLRRFHLFGFSGGGQFAHRYAMLHPARVRSLHVVAAGYYTYLDRTVSWPRGTGGREPGQAVRANCNFFLRLPIHVYVGDRDTERDPALRSGPKVDAQQGLTRMDRARAWVEHVARRQAGSGPAPTFDTIPGAAHSFAEMSLGLAAPLPRLVAERLHRAGRVLPGLRAAQHAVRTEPAPAVPD